MTQIRVHLTGEQAHLGTVSAADVARLILLVERAASRAASVVLGKPKTTTGRYEDVIEQAVRFRLLSVEEGSVVPVLELPEMSLPEGTLDVDAPTLGEAALELLLAAAEAPEPAHPVVARALLEIAESLHLGDRYEAVTFESAANGRSRRKVRIDRDTKTRLRARVASAPSPPVRADAVVGVLVEADFEKRTARLRTPTEPAVQVVFTEDLDDDIQGALRQPATLQGEVEYDRETHVARSVRLRALLRGEQLVLGLDADEYWLARSFSDLAREQQAGTPIDDVRSFFDADASEEERDAFMAALAELG